MDHDLEEVRVAATRSYHQGSDGLAALPRVLLEPWGGDGNRAGAFPRSSARSHHSRGALSGTMGLVDLAFKDLRDEDLHWADLVKVSAMEVQREEVRQILALRFEARAPNHDWRALCQQRT